MRIQKGKIFYTLENNPDGTFNVLRIKQYTQISGISMNEKDAKELIKLLEKQNIKPNEII